MVEMERTEWSALRRENSNKIESPDIPDFDATDAALRWNHTTTFGPTFANA